MRALSYLSIVAQPWRYDDPQPLTVLHERLREIYPGEARRWWLMTNGRSALYAFLKGLEAQRGDEVILQAFTCVAAVNPIVWAGFNPVFVDMDADTFAISLLSLERHITDRTRAIVVQHTFGLPAPIEEITALGRNRGIVVVEDCAHALGLESGGDMLGTTGDAAILSFGIEKTLRTKAGGALLLNNPELAAGIGNAVRNLSPLPRGETFRWLIWPLLKSLLWRLPDSTEQRATSTLEWISLLRRAVSREELEGGMPPGTPSFLSAALARVILAEMAGLASNLAHRSEICSLYGRLLWDAPHLSLPPASGRPLLRYPILCANPEVRRRLRIRLDTISTQVTTWYDPPVFPRGVDLQRLGYDASTVPVAEDCATRVLCLPTGPSTDRDRAEQIANEILDRRRKADRRYPP